MRREIADLALAVDGQADVAVRALPYVADAAHGFREQRPTADHALAVDGDDLVRRRPEGDVEDRAVLGDVEVLAAVRLLDALAQAGAYIEETGRPLSEYLALFRQRPMALLERPASFPFTVATTMSLNCCALVKRPIVRRFFASV